MTERMIVVYDILIDDKSRSDRDWGSTRYPARRIVKYRR